MSADGIRALPAHWQDMVLVCGKCSRKLDGGFGPDGKRSLAKALRKFLGTKKGRKAPIGVIEIGCLDICPKHAVTLLRGSRPDDWLIVPAGTALPELADRLNLGAAVPEARTAPVPWSARARRLR